MSTQPGYLETIRTKANNLIALVSPRGKPTEAPKSDTPRSLATAIETSGAAASVAKEESKSPRGSTAPRGSVYDIYDPTKAGQSGSPRNLSVDTSDSSFEPAPLTVTPASTRAQRAFDALIAIGTAMQQVATGLYNLVSPNPSNPPRGRRDTIGVYVPYQFQNTDANGAPAEAPTPPPTHQAGRRDTIGEYSSYCPKATDAEVDAAKAAYHHRQQELDK